MTSKKKEKEGKEQGRWNDVLTQNNITDPRIKTRNKNGFPETPSSASGILRKKFIEFVSTVKKEGRDKVTSTLREARKTFLGIAVAIAAGFGPADLTAVILGSAYYEMGPYKSRGVTLTKTNQFIQGKYCKNLSTEDDIGAVNLKGARDLGIQQILGLSNCLMEASCQVNARNEGKSAFKVSKGYKGKKKHNVAGNRKSLHEHSRELMVANSVSHFYNKCAAVEKHGLPTLSRILHTCVCPHFSPKDYAPKAEEEVEVMREKFMIATDRYYDAVFGETMDIMIEARESVKTDLEASDEDFHCIFDGDLVDGFLISKPRADVNSEYNTVNRSFSGIVVSFQSFILESSTNFRSRGEQYFESQRKLYASEGGLDSNKAMMNYGMAIPMVLAESGIFLGSSDTMELSKKIYDEVKSEHPELGLPDISTKFLSDLDASSDREFSESNLVKNMETKDLTTEGVTLDKKNFTEIYENLNAETKWDVSRNLEFDKVAVIIGGGDLEGNADVKVVSKQYDERRSHRRAVGIIQPGDHDAYEALKTRREANGGKLDETDEAKFQELHLKIQLLRNSTSRININPFCSRSMVFKDEEATAEFLRGKRGDYLYSNVVFIFPFFNLLVDIKARFDQEPDAEGKRLVDVIENRPRPCTDFKLFLTDTEFMNLVNLDTNQKTALIAAYSLTEVKSYREVPLNAQGETIYHSIQDMIWRHLTLDEHLALAQSERIEGVFSKVKLAIINLMSCGDTMTHVEKEGLIRYAVTLFFKVSEPKGDITQVVLTPEVGDLPIGCDMTLMDFLNLASLGEIMSQIMLKECEFIGKNASETLQFMKDEVAEQAKLGRGDKKRKKIFNFEKKGGDISLTASGTASLCTKKGLFIIQRKDPDPNCVFHTLAVITKSMKEPGEMRQEVHDAVANTGSYDGFFLKDEPQPSDRILKTKEDWLKDILNPQTFGDEVVMHYFMEGHGKETVAYHTDGYQVIFNEGKERSDCHLLCVDSISCYPVGVTVSHRPNEGDLNEKIEELGKSMTVRDTPDEEESGKGKKKKEFGEKDKKALRNAVMGEVLACQSSCDNIGFQRNMTVGDKNYKPKIIKKDKEGEAEKEDWQVEFVHEIGAETFKYWISDLVDHMIEKEYGITFGKGYLLEDYSYAEGKEDAFAASKITIKKLQDELEKEKEDQTAASSGDQGGSSPHQDQEAEVDEEETSGGKPQGEKVAGDYPSARKMCFSTEVLYVELMTYIRICIAIISCVSIFYQRQTLNMEQFTMDTVSWMEKRINTGLPEQVWKNLFIVLQRNMKKCFTKEDLYLYPLLNRKSNIVGAVGSASLMPTELSYLMNGGDKEGAFGRLCEVCVMSCKANIPENAVHPIHQFILNSLMRELFLANKTDFSADLWSYVRFGSEDEALSKSFQKGKPKQADDTPEGSDGAPKEDDDDEEEDGEDGHDEEAVDVE